MGPTPALVIAWRLFTLELLSESGERLAIVGLSPCSRPAGRLEAVEELESKETEVETKFNPRLFFLRSSCNVTLITVTLDRSPSISATMELQRKEDEEWEICNALKRSSLAESAKPAATPSKDARAGKAQIPAGRAKTTAADTKKKRATASGGVKKHSQSQSKGKQTIDKAKASRLEAALDLLKDAAPVRTIRRRPKAEDFPWGSNKETTTTSSTTSDNTSLPGLSDTTVPREAQSDQRLANEQDERTVCSLEELIKSTAERFEPVSLPPTPPTTSANPSLATTSRPFDDDDVALCDAPPSRPTPDFGQYRERPEGSDSEGGDSEDEQGYESDEEDIREKEEEEEEDIREKGESRPNEADDDEVEDVEFFDAPEVQQPEFEGPAVQAAVGVEIEFRDFVEFEDDVAAESQAFPAVCAGDVEMTPVSNPFGAPAGAPSPAAPMFGGSSGFTHTSSSPFAQQSAPTTQQPPMATGFASSGSPFGASPSPFAQPSHPQPAPTSFGAAPFSQLPQPASTTASAFGAPSGLSLPQTANQARQPSPGPIANPFAPSPKTQQPASSSNTVPASSPFGIFSNSLSDSAQIGVTKPNPFEALKNTSKPAFAQQSGAAKPNPFDAFTNQPRPSPAVAASPFGGGAKKAVRFADDVQSNAVPAPKMGGEARFAPQPSEGTKQLSSLAVDYAQKVNAQLRGDGISAPKWPSDPGNPAQRPAMERLKESYKKYRAKAYDSLRKAEIIDHPDHKRRLEDALTFKGICEDMCPDYEQVTRICEYDVKKEEKRPGPNGGDPWPEPSKMVKKFARSAAGIEEPLPMDVRSIDALRRSTDYLLGDLLQTDDQLPSLHSYLWDRTRAVRKDFSFHSHKTPEEMKVIVYILETIARFHVVSLHLLSRRGVASDDFDQQQEVQQLGATLLSLNETYDDCRPRGLVCENEGEFRALFLLLNKGDTAVVEKSLEWASQPWYNSTHMENAKSLLAALQSFDQVTGPFNPRALGGHIAAPAFTKFFDLVGSKNVSYTMACMCEIHFTWVRQRILQTLVKGFARRRDWPKDITPRILNRMLRFDTEEEAVEFVKLHEFEFETRQVDGRQEQFLLLKSKRQHVPSPRVLQSHSATIVEAKRDGQPLAEVFRKSVYGDKDIEFNDGEPDRSHLLLLDSADNVDSDDGDDMFVGQSLRKTAGPTTDIDGRLQQAHQATPTFGAPSASPFAAKPSPFAGDTNPFGAPSSANASPFAAKPSPFTSTDATSNISEPPNGKLPNGTAAAPALSSAPAASPFLQGNGQPSTTFESSALAAQKPDTNNGPATPASQPAKAPETSAFSFLGAAQNKTQAPAPGASVFADISKTSSPFAGFPGGSSQTSTPTAATPSTVNKDTSTAGAKTATPQSSIFSALTSEKSTPPSGSFFPTSTAPISSPSGAQPSATSTAPATSIFSPAGTAGMDKPTSAAPSTTSVFTQPPATTSSTAAPSSQPPQLKSVSTASQNVQAHVEPSPPTSAPLPPSTAPPPASDPMADFTKWFVQGDGGLLEEFTEFAVEDILVHTYQQWQDEEAERQRREEDEASWAAAREHMAYRLGVKFFYRWREAARARATRRILREGKAKYKAAMGERARAKREKQQAERKAAERKKRDEEARREERLRNFTAADELEKIIAETRRSRQSSAEEALLASGVFAGVKNEREVARRVVKEAYMPVKKHRPTTSTRTSSMSMPPPPPVETPVKKEGWKTRSIREKLHLSSKRRDSFSSASAAGTGASNLSQSLPVGGGRPARAPKITNFSASTSSRKRSADTSDDEPEAKKGRILKSGLSLHWELRRRGLVQMPDGQWLPSRIATQMFEGKRFPGYGNCGLGPGTARVVDDKQEEAAGHHLSDKDGDDRRNNTNMTMKAKPSGASARESKLEALARRFGFPPTKRYRRDSFASGSSSYYQATPSSMLSSSPGGGGKRKRTAEEDDDEAGSPTVKKAYVVVDSSSDNESGGSNDEALTPAKKVEKALNKMRRQLRELNEDMDVLESEDTPWMRREMERMRAANPGKGYGALDGGVVRDEGGPGGGV